ncbi:MAG: D-tyrosyl-tRNA(Tyr) deacylase [Lentisphaerae bacterium GWF2_44_16]|nr:MAG: D-tyrosyl-tRNA(Tyr) deacylase [Lentisphaerae bacterium GWF2_44_16]
MKALVQRVSSASVTIENSVVGKIGQGLLILLGITHGDTVKEVSFIADKCANLRIFKDGEDKMNLSLLDIGGEALVVSQFTLYGDARKGRRPGFTDAARPEHAIPLYEKFIEELRKAGINTATGQFGAEMQVDLCNSGPVTIMIET